MHIPDFIFVVGNVLETCAIMLAIYLPSLTLQLIGPTLTHPLMHAFTTQADLCRVMDAQSAEHRAPTASEEAHGCDAGAAEVQKKQYEGRCI